MNKSTLGLFNATGCHGNSVLLYGDGGEKKGVAAGLGEERGAVYCLCRSGTLQNVGQMQKDAHGREVYQ